jgi:hypothetical protein
LIVGGTTEQVVQRGCCVAGCFHRREALNH